MLAATQPKLDTIAAIYRSLRMPTVSTMAGNILRELDRRSMLGTGVMVVGTNTMAAYEIAALERFATGLDATDDFDMTWAGDRNVVFNIDRTKRGNLLSALKAVDASFTVNMEKPHQARNAQQYEVELLLAPSRSADYPPDEDLRPVDNLPEQEWLLKGRPIDEVVCDRSGKPCRLVVPDPRWMALHKLWLADKPDRNPRKKDKDRKQGQALLAILPRGMPHYPLDEAFLREVPVDLERYLPLP